MLEDGRCFLLSIRFQNLFLYDNKVNTFVRKEMLILWQILLSENACSYVQLALPKGSSVAYLTVSTVGVHKSQEQDSIAVIKTDLTQMVTSYFDSGRKALLDGMLLKAVCVGLLSNVVIGRISGAPVDFCSSKRSDCAFFLRLLFMEEARPNNSCFCLFNPRSSSVTPILLARNIFSGHIDLIDLSCLVFLTISSALNH